MRMYASRAARKCAGGASCTRSRPSRARPTRYHGFLPRVLHEAVRSVRGERHSGVRSPPRNHGGHQAFKRSADDDSGSEFSVSRFSRFDCAGATTYPRQGHRRAVCAVLGLPPFAAPDREASGSTGAHVWPCSAGTLAGVEWDAFRSVAFMNFVVLLAICRRRQRVLSAVEAHVHSCTSSRGSQF
jgi:hypothetical protein